MPKWDRENISKALERRKSIEILHEKLLSNIKTNLSKLRTLLKEVSGHWEAEDCIYRFYHHSYKVYHIQHHTLKIVTMLKSLAPDDWELNEDFIKIIKNGTGKEFKMSHNREWGKHTRPLIEAFLHSRYFLEMLVKYGKELKKAPQCLPSGWALTLYLYDLR